MLQNLKANKLNYKQNIMLQTLKANKFNYKYKKVGNKLSCLIQRLINYIVVADI